MTHTEAVTPSLASMLSTCTTSRSWAEQDEGPYHRDAPPLRRDIVEDREGVPLHLGVRLAGDDGTRMGSDHVLSLMPYADRPGFRSVRTMSTRSW